MIALYITLCLWSHGGTPVCRELPLTPGVAGPLFDSADACVAGQQAALARWFTEAGPVFGIKDMQGEGYRIAAVRCGPVEHTADPDGE